MITNTVSFFLILLVSARMYVCLCVGGGEWGGGVREIVFVCWGWGVGRGREGGGETDCASFCISMLRDII